MSTSLESQLNRISASLPTPAGPELDLSTDGIMTYLHRQPPIVRRMLEAMEDVEVWAADQDYDAVDSLYRLGRELRPEDFESLGQSPSADLVRLLGMISMTRLLMLVDRLVVEGHGTRVDFIDRARDAAQVDPESVDAFKIVFNRLLYLSRRKLLQRIYAPKRAQQLSNALRAIAVT